MTRIAVFVGSLREGSLNKKLAKSLQTYLPEGVEFDYINIAAAPLYNEDLEADFPASALSIKQQIEAADGVLFVTPEYNRAVPGVLKNVIDWVSRPWGQNSLAGKPAAVIGISGSTLGTALAQTQLRSTLLYLDTLLIGQPEIYIPNGFDVFDEEGVPNERVSEKLQEFAARFIQHVEYNK